MQQKSLRPVIFSRRAILRVGLLVITGLITLVLLALPIAIRPSSYQLNVGDVSSQDIQAPYEATFDSAYLTDQARNEAEASVQAVYLPVDPAITRAQIEHLRVVLEYISSVRYDNYASQAQKNADLSNITNFQLSPETIDSILSLTEARWQVVQTEALSVLERVMRNTIRAGNVAENQNSVPSLISYTIPQDQAAIIDEIVAQFIVPNSLYSEEQTLLAQQAARDAVKPVPRTYAAGESIVRRGQVITPQIYEALQVYNLVRSQDGFQSLAAILALVVVATVFVGLYFSQRQVMPLNDAKSLILIAGLFLVFLSGARIVIPNRAVIPYLFPLSAFGLTVASLYNTEIGLILSFLLSILAGYNLSNSLDLTIF